MKSEWNNQYSSLKTLEYAELISKLCITFMIHAPLKKVKCC